MLRGNWGTLAPPCRCETAIIKTVLEQEQGWKMRRSGVRRRKKLAKVRIRKKGKRYYATRVIYIRYIFTTVSRNLFVILYFTRQDSNVLWIKKKKKRKTKSHVNITCELCKISLEKDKFLMYNGIEKNKVKHIRIMNYSLPIRNTLENYVWCWMSLRIIESMNLSIYLQLFSFFLF